MSSATAIVVSLSAFALLAAADIGVAHADTHRISGASCVPAAETIQNDRYETGAIGVQMKGSGTARFICRVESDSDTWHGFRLFYQDGDGSNGVAAEVKAKFREAEMESPIAKNLCTASSTTNASNTTGFTFLNCQLPSALAPEPDTYYWFEVTLRRDAGSTVPVEFLGVAVF